MEVGIDGETFEVESAHNFWRRAWGLSLRKEGKMLFKFPRPTNAKIDMALLSRPLYLYFFDSNRKLIHREKAMPWTWNPRTWSFYRPDEKYQYLLESFEDLKIDESSRLEI